MNGPTMQNCPQPRVSGAVSGAVAVKRGECGFLSLCFYLVGMAGFEPATPRLERGDPRQSDYLRLDQTFLLLTVPLLIRSSAERRANKLHRFSTD